MIDGAGSGHVAMYASWGALALACYVALSGASMRGVTLAATIVVLIAVAGLAGMFAADRGWRVGDGAIWAALLGVLIGVGRRALNRRPAHEPPHRRGRDEADPS